MSVSLSSVMTIPRPVMTCLFVCPFVRLCYLYILIENRRGIPLEALYSRLRSDLFSSDIFVDFFFFFRFFRFHSRVVKKAMSTNKRVQRIYAAYDIRIPDAISEALLRCDSGRSDNIFNVLL